MRLPPAPLSLLPLLSLAPLLTLLPGCHRHPPPPPDRPGLGTVMLQVAHRFELAGRAATANRFELAEFEAGELTELFTSDVPHAQPPGEGPTAHIPAMAKAFLATNAPDLAKAAATHDPTAFAAAFQRTAAACNACHQASAKAFIQVPSVPGKSVPDLDPVPQH